MAGAPTPVAFRWPDSRHHASSACVEIHRAALRERRKHEGAGDFPLWLAETRTAPRPTVSIRIRRFLKRIERDPNGAPIKLYPFTRKSHATDEAAPMEMDPRVAFGRPVLVGRGVPTANLADRFKAGDSLADLAEDCDTSTQNIEEAIRCELTRREAA